MIISNERPTFHDPSGAIVSRFVMPRLTESWLGREDIRLTGELMGELPGILNWALDGLGRLDSNGAFTEPAASADAIATAPPRAWPDLPGTRCQRSLQDAVSPEGAFLRDECLPDSEVPCSELFAARKEWAAPRGYKAGDEGSFGTALRAVLRQVVTTPHCLPPASRYSAVHRPPVCSLTLPTSTTSPQGSDHQREGAGRAHSRHPEDTGRGRGGA